MDKMINRLCPILFLFITACGNDCNPVAIPCHKSIIFLDIFPPLNDGMPGIFILKFETDADPDIAPYIASPTTAA